MLSNFPLIWLCILPTFISASQAPEITISPRHYAFHRKHLNPSPTPAPYPHGRLRRQSTTIQRTLLAAPDQTCGYFGGASDRPWGCQAGNCVFATPTPIVNISLSAGPGKWGHKINQWFGGPWDFDLHVRTLHLLQHRHIRNPVHLRLLLQLPLQHRSPKRNDNIWRPNRPRLHTYDTRLRRICHTYYLLSPFNLCRFFNQSVGNRGRE
ncbi:hypothetical protein D0Z07_5996 [Hyphodiscus hymeniophilus]|uniref:Uncharacterized protein n=1 Tax=Hyphodiscus hymeniophilus TaxID=353542 RepID=A0A9P6VH42_9HELO|nr:hypothetical protein D0Z07_5996 [Hyphodiscus hymeniophilus]